MRRMVFVLYALISLTSYADPVTVPNTFSAGTPAKASEVNANFTALANAVNNYPKPLMVYDSNDKIIGQYEVSFSYVIINSPSDGLLHLRFTRAGFLSSNNFYTYYKDSYCGGTPYYPANGDEFVSNVNSYGSDNEIFTSGYIVTGPFQNITVETKKDKNGACWLAYSLNGYFSQNIKQVDLSGWTPPFSVH